MAKQQITVRLDPQEKLAFDEYTAKLGLDASELAKILIVREERLKRLLALKNKQKIPQFKRQSWGKGVTKPTVTAHFSNSADVDAFDRYARDCGLNRQGAAAWLLTAELKEQWFEKALSLNIR